MKPPRRNFLHLAAGAAALPAVARFAWAQSYPSRPVRLIVPLPPVGATDGVAHLIGQWLSERLGQPFLVENRRGDNSNVATEAVVRAPPDGYTLLEATLRNASNATLYQKLNFTFIRDIAPISFIGRIDYVIQVNPSFPAKTVPELITFAKANPGKVRYASPGTGSPGHMAGELFNMMTGVGMARAAYPNAALALAASTANWLAGSLPDGQSEEGDACTDFARLAARPEALDRADPRHHEAAPPRRKHRRGSGQLDGRRHQGDRGRALQDHRARRALSRASATAWVEAMRWRASASSANTSICTGVVELSVIVLTQHGEQLLELVAVLPTELQFGEEIIPGFVVDRERVADGLACFLPSPRLRRTQGC